MTRKEQISFCITLKSGKVNDIVIHGDKIFNSGAWNKEWKKFKDFLLSDDSIPYNIFVKGNSKLPFWNFSTLPLFTCPGAGKCVSYCYSFKSWRYPVAFFRQCQNTWMIKNPYYRRIIAQAFSKINGTVRLYVDGDFDSFSTFRYWMGLVRKNKQIQTYGYSKSLPFFIKWNKLGYSFPSNYKLNLSNGGRFNGEYKEKIKELSCYRGEFNAIKIGNQSETRKFTKKEVRKKIAAQVIGKFFVCPGKCGFCAMGSHACGNDKFKNINIVIPVH